MCINSSVNNSKASMTLGKAEVTVIVGTILENQQLTPSFTNVVFLSGGKIFSNLMVILIGCNRNSLQ